MKYYCVAIKTLQNQVIVTTYFTHKNKRNQYLKWAKDRYAEKIFYSCEFEGEFKVKNDE